MSKVASTSTFFQDTEERRIKEWEDKYIDYLKLKEFINDPRK